MFSRLYGLSVGVLRVLRSPPSELKIDRKKDTLRNTECLIVLTCFSFVISRMAEVERFELSL